MIKCELLTYKAEKATFCPFCGSESVNVYHKQKHFCGYNFLGHKKLDMQVYCRCNKCGARGGFITYIGYDNMKSDEYNEEQPPKYYYGDKAIEAWNRRAEV